MSLVELDRVGVQDHLDLVGAAAEFTAAALTARQSLALVVRLARRIVQDPSLTDEQVVTAAYPIANGLRLSLLSSMTGQAVSGG